MLTGTQVFDTLEKMPEQFSIDRLFDRLPAPSGSSKRVCATRFLFRCNKVIFLSQIF
jgi:hypothetical protein